MIKIICCYNDKDQYNDMIATIKLSSDSYALIPVDNTDGRFSSAAAALNYGAAQAEYGDILIFTHQDIIFHEGSIDKLAQYAIYNTIAGPFGAARDPKPYGREQGSDALEVETLDECCAAMTYDTWNRYRFNETVCDTWHMYVVELCLRMRLGGGTVILVQNTGIEHLSYGNVDMSYMRTYKRVIKEFLHSKDIPWIATTCRSYPTTWVGFYRLFIPRYIKRNLKEALRGKYVRIK